MLPPGATLPGREEPQPCTAVTPEPAGTRVALLGIFFFGEGGSWSPPPCPEVQPTARSRSLVRCPENLSPLSLNAELPVCSAMAMKKQPPPPKKNTPAPKPKGFKAKTTVQLHLFLVFLFFHLKEVRPGRCPPPIWEQHPQALALGSRGGGADTLTGWGGGGKGLVFLIPEFTLTAGLRGRDRRARARGAPSPLLRPSEVNQGDEAAWGWGLGGGTQAVAPSPAPPSPFLVRCRRFPAYQRTPTPWCSRSLPSSTSS